MADENRLSESLSQNVLTLLCFSNQNGALAAMLVKADEFAEPYDIIASRALDYRQRYNAAPGEAHTADLFDDQLRDPKSDQGQLFLRILRSLFTLSKSINEKFVIDRLGEFSKVQNYKRALMSSLERIKDGGDGISDDLEQIFTNAISFQPQPADTGLVMADTNLSLAFTEETASDKILLGIDIFDRLGIVPAKGELFGFVAPRKRGKSMFCTHVTRQALLQHWKVLYVSLELSEMRLAQRIFQNLFAVAKRPDRYNIQRFTLDDMGGLMGFKPSEMTPDMSINNPNVREWLLGKINGLDTNLEYIRIKRFPSGQLTMGMFKSYLDLLDRLYNFVPDACIVDYPGIAKLNPENYRLELGQFIVDLRGVCIERNMAMVVPHQSTRSGEDAKVLTAKHAAEDISLFATADNVVTYNATAMERKMGLARLLAAAVRNDRSDVTVVISQAYDISQFVVDSAMENQFYQNKIEALGATGGKEDDE